MRILIQVNHRIIVHARLWEREQVEDDEGEGGYVNAEGDAYPPFGFVAAPDDQADDSPLWEEDDDME